MEQTTFIGIVVAVSVAFFFLLCIFVGCLIKLCCPYWMSEKVRKLRERIYKTERNNYATKGPSLFTSNSNRSHTSGARCKRNNIPIVIVSDENGKRIMHGKDAACVYERQDREEIL